MVDENGDRLRPMVRNLDEAFRQIGELRRELVKQEERHQRTVLAILDTLDDQAHRLLVLETAAELYPGMAYYMRRAEGVLAGEGTD